MKRTVTAAFQVVTPMFLGGVDQQPEGIRAASVKGALRFWWRAWAWDAIRTQHPDDLTALRALHAREAHLFGLAAKDGKNDAVKGGQGVFIMHVRDDQVGKVLSAPFGRSFDNGILYLLGMGLGSFKDGNHCTRSAIPAARNGQDPSFEIKLIFKPGTSPEDEKSVITALRLFGALGALGSRARHGMGSVRLIRLQGEGWTDWQAPQSVEDYKKELNSLWPKPQSDRLPPLSAFSRQTRLDISAQHASHIRLLDDVGREQQLYRSFGRDGKVNRVTAERNFRSDHDLIFDATAGKEVSQVPKRVVFGLPHNYFFSSTNAKADVNYRPEEGEGRRASPLLLHVHRLGEVHFAVHLLLPAQFLPPSAVGQAAKIEVGINNNRRKAAVSVKESDIHWKVLHNYLNRYSSRETIYD